MRWVLVLLALGAGPAMAQSFGSPRRYTENGGEAIYRGVCAACHMPDGRGAVGAAAYPSLVDNPHLAEKGYLIGLVLHGQKAMPGFARTLSDQQIADVVGFIRGHFGNDYSGVPGAEEVRAAR